MNITNEEAVKLCFHLSSKYIQLFDTLVTLLYNTIWFYDYTSTVPVSNVVNGVESEMVSLIHGEWIPYNLLWLRKKVLTYSRSPVPDVSPVIFDPCPHRCKWGCRLQCHTHTGESGSMVQSAGWSYRIHPKKTEWNLITVHNGSLYLNLATL